MRETLVIYSRFSSMKETYLMKYEHLTFLKKKIIKEEKYSKYFSHYYFKVRHPDDNEEIITYQKIPLIKKYKGNSNTTNDALNVIVGITDVLYDASKDKSVTSFSKKDTLISNELIETICDFNLQTNFMLQETSSVSTTKYQEVLQSLVNKLQVQSYIVDIKSLSLFMDSKIDKLIMIRNK